MLFDIELHQVDARRLAFKMWYGAETRFLISADGAGVFRIGIDDDRLVTLACQIEGEGASKGGA